MLPENFERCDFFMLRRDADSSLYRRTLQIILWGGLGTISIFLSAIIFGSRTYLSEAFLAGPWYGMLIVFAYALLPLGIWFISKIPWQSERHQRTNADQ